MLSIHIFYFCIFLYIDVTSQNLLKRKKRIFDVIFYLNLVLLFFVVMDFIFYFVLRDFVPVPNEQNLFVAAQLGFSLAKFLSVARNVTGGGTRRVLRHFTFYFVLCCLFYSL